MCVCVCVWVCLCLALLLVLSGPDRMGLGHFSLILTHGSLPLPFSSSFLPYALPVSPSPFFYLGSQQEGVDLSNQGREEETKRKKTTTGIIGRETGPVEE